MISWLGDFFRFWWSLLYWNAAKELFRRKKVSRCPCQSPSDSGKAGETRCEACVSWNRPSRFKRVCPLLVDTPDGLMCSVDTADVRPFWKPMLAWYGGSLAGVYLAAVLVAFVGLRMLGFPVNVINLAWPGRWHRLNEARAEYYFEKGAGSFVEGDLRAASMSLSLAYRFDPNRYDAGMMLGEIATLAIPDRADAIYAGLIQRHPEKIEQTAQAWMRSALQRGDFVALSQISLARLESGQTPPAPWLHALLFATRMLGDSELLQKFADSKAGLPWRTLLSTELDIRMGRTQAAVAALSESWYPQKTYNAYYQTERLLELRHPSEALITMAAYQGALSGSEQAAIKLGALKMMSTPDAWHAQVRELLHKTPTSPAAVELFAGHLLRYPDVVALGDVIAWLKGSPLPVGDASVRAYLMLYCGAGACGDRPALEWISSVLRTQSSNRFYFLETVKSYFLDPDSRIRPPDFLPVVPLPLDMVYGIWDRELVLSKQRAEKAKKRPGSGGPVGPGLQTPTAQP